MSKSKNLVYVGPADDANHKPLHVEEIALEADIAPGMLLGVTAAGFSKSPAIATVFGKQPFFADKNFLQGGSITEPWAISNSMVAIHARSGEFINAMVAASTAITTRGMPLASVGDGTLAIATTDGTNDIIAYSNEIITTGASPELVQVRIS